MNNVSEEFNEQLKLDVLVNGLSEITLKYVNQFNRDKLTEVIIPEGVTAIGEKAFAMLHSLKTVIIPDTVTEIGKCAFHMCDNLESVTIGNGVSCIKDATFDFCYKLKNVTMPEDITIEKGAFFCCNNLPQLASLPEEFEKMLAESVA